MSNKEQKLRNNLYKTLTEYLLHGSKNTPHSLKASQESFLDQLASFRMETALPIAVKQDIKYQKAQARLLLFSLRSISNSLFHSPFLPTFNLYRNGNPVAVLNG